MEKLQGARGEFVVGAVEEEARRPERASVRVMIQLEAAKQRLAWAAEKQAELRSEGWRIERAEWEFHEPDPWLVHDMPVRGVIDRIDRHEKSGALRVIDYKTSSTPVPPDGAHLSAFRRNENPDDRPEWSKTEDADGNLLAWVDLQLPLYVHAVRERFPGADRGKIECAYFNLTRAVTETCVLPWDDLDAGLLAAARRCAGGVIDAVRNREFWPPSASVPFDEFEDLFFGDAEESVDEDHFRSVLESSPLQP